MVAHVLQRHPPLAREDNRGEASIRVGGSVVDDAEPERVGLSPRYRFPVDPRHGAADYLHEVQLVDQDVSRVLGLWPPGEGDARAPALDARGEW